MKTTIIINTDSITHEFIEGMKALFPHQTVEITIQSTDIGDYKTSLDYGKELGEKVEAYNKNKEKKTKGTKNRKNLQVPGEPLSDKELAKLVKIAEKGPFNTLEEHNKKMNDWIKQLSQ